MHLAGEPEAQLYLGDHGTGEGLRQPHGVADVVVVTVCDEDRVDAVRLELGGGAARVPGQEGVDVDALARRRVDAERGVAEPGQSRRGRHAGRVDDRSPEIEQSRHRRNRGEA